MTQAFIIEENIDIFDTSLNICISPENGITVITFKIPIWGRMSPTGGFVGKKVAYSKNDVKYFLHAWTTDVVLAFGEDNKTCNWINAVSIIGFNTNLFPFNVVTLDKNHLLSDWCKSFRLFGNSVDWFPCEKNFIRVSSSVTCYHSFNF